MRVCSKPGCPILIPKAGHCPEHSALADKARGSRQHRGYDNAHVTLRAQWKPLVDAGGVSCSRCGDLIAAGQPWHLDHDDEDRSKYRGPSHAGCNLTAAGVKSHL